MSEQILKKTAPQYKSKSLNGKKHSGKSPDVQFKEFSLTKQILDLKRTKGELGKHFPKIPDKKQYQNVACEQKTTCKKEKFGPNKKNRPRMNYEWIEKTI